MTGMKTTSSVNSKTAKSTGFHHLILAAGVALGLGAGCQRAETRIDHADISAAYRLIAVDGQSIPASVNHDGARLEIRAGEFVIRPDGTCSSDTTFVPPSGHEVRRKVAASYTRKEHQLRMKWTGAGTTLGQVQGDRFTMTNEGMVLVYQR
jgi:hypothetical protein